MKSIVFILLVLSCIGSSANYAKVTENYVTTADLSSEQIIQIRAKFESLKDKLASHFVAALKSSPNLKGKFEIELLISPSGDVKNFLILHNQLENNLLEDNFSNEIQNLNFGFISEKFIKVNYTYVFFPN